MKFILEKDLIEHLENILLKEKEEEYLMDIVRTIVKCLKIGDRERIHGENVILKRISKSTIRKRVEYIKDHFKEDSNEKLIEKVSELKAFLGE